MIKRKDYLSKKATFREYYLEIAHDAGIRVPHHIMEKVQKSTDPYFNDVPLKLWDALAEPIISAKFGQAFRVRGDYPTLAGIVCTYKVLAREMLGD